MDDDISRIADDMDEVVRMNVELEAAKKAEDDN